MDTGWLEDFLVLAEQLNFSRAAERRHVTQSAMSRRIQALEDWLGTPLFSRETHRLGITAAGETFRKTALDVMRLLESGREIARETADRDALPLRFAATHALSLSFFPRWLQEIELAAPIGPVRLTADTMAACERLIERGEAQFLLCHRHPKVPDVLSGDSYRCQVLGVDTVIPVSAPDSDGRPLHVLQAEAAADGAAPRKVPFLAYDERSGLGRIIGGIHRLDKRSDRVEPVFMSHLATVLHVMALERRGLAFLPRSLVEADLREGRLVLAGPDDMEMTVEICLYRLRARQSAAAEAFWHRLASHQAR